MSLKVIGEKAMYSSHFGDEDIETQALIRKHLVSIALSNRVLEKIDQEAT